MQQTRRRFLTTASLSSAAALAGCIGESGAPAPETTPDTTTTTATPAFSGCPSLRAHADETVCAATAPDDAPVVLRPSATELSAPGTLRFMLTNGRETSIGLNPYDWAVHRKTDGRWEKVAPDMVIQPWYEIPPGESQSWALRVGDDATDTTTANASRTTNTTATDDGALTTSTTTTSGGDTIECGPLDLGTGTYAFSVVAAAAETRTAYVARFRVAGAAPGSPSLSGRGE